MKVRVARQNPKSLISLARIIKKEWNSLPVEYAENLTNSMKKRINDCIAANGDFI